MISRLVGLSKGFKSELGKSVGIDVDWHWFSPYVGDSTARSNRSVRDVDCLASRIENSTTASDKRVEVAGIFWVKWGDVIYGLDTGKRTNIVSLAGVGEGIIFGPNKGLRLAGGPMAGLGAKNLTTALDKRVKSAGIPWAKRKDISNRLDEGKRTDAICLIGMGGERIFGSDKGFRVAGRHIAELSASIASNKRARPNANYLPYKRRSPSPKLKKGSRGAWGPGGRWGVSVTALGKRKGGKGRPEFGKGCWITGLEIRVVDIDNLGDSTILLF